MTQLLVNSGELQPEQVAMHPARGRLTRYVGMSGEPLPEARVVTLQPGDKLLLCSDGLTGLVEDAELLRILKQRCDLGTICDELVAAANRAGGKDNVTALVWSARDSSHALQSAHTSSNRQPTGWPRSSVSQA